MFSHRTKVALAIATIIVAFLHRGDFRDAYRAWKRGPIPQEVTRQEVISPAPSVIPAKAGIQKTPEKIAPSPKPATIKPTPKPTPEPTPTPIVPVVKPAPEEPTTLPSTFNLKLAFIPQAPLLVWDDLHKDACEEAAMLMVDAYLRDIPSYTSEESDALLQTFVAYEAEQGDGPSIPLARAAELMSEHLGIKNAKVVPIDSIADVKEAIAAGHPVILPAAGKLLFNPYFKNGGPLYHMLVAKGYTETTVITHDPGTRYGTNYAYTDETLWNAIHDWNDGDVENGAKLMLIAN